MHATRKVVSTCRAHAMSARTYVRGDVSRDVRTGVHHDHPLAPPSLDLRGAWNQGNRLCPRCKGTQRDRTGSATKSHAQASGVAPLISIKREAAVGILGTGGRTGGSPGVAALICNQKDKGYMAARWGYGSLSCQLVDLRAPEGGAVFRTLRTRTLAV